MRIAELDAHIRKTWDRTNATGPTLETHPAWMTHFLAMLEWGAGQRFFERKLQQADTLLLDGLDEAPSQERRERMAKLLVEVARQYRKCRIVVTTRPQALRGEARPAGFEEVWIDALDEESVELFVRRWCSCVYANDPALAERARVALSAALQAREVREMARNPMMLSALAAIHLTGGRLPDNRLELYDLVVEWLARSRKDLPGQPDWETRLERLRLLALGMQTHPGGRVRQIEVGEGATLLSPLLGEKDALRCLRDEEADSGILAVRGDNVEFLHLLFQEYLAARELDANEPEISATIWKDRRLYSLEWREVMRFLAAMMRRSGPRKANRLFDAVLERTGTSPADRARTVALLTLLKDDLRRRDSDGTATEFAVSNGRYADLVREMVGLFEDAEAGAGLDMATRAAAAEAWERLGDVSRLRLPSDPEYWVDLGRFRMGRYPVTVWEYARFVYAGGPEPSLWQEQLAYGNRPVVAVNWHEVVQYCEWAREAYHCEGCRLPASAEWEFAAAGEAGRKYPWGSPEPDDERANYDVRAGHVTPVGLFPKGNTPEGVVDLAGNVWEWTGSEHETYPGSKVVRGASFFNVAFNLRAALRYRFVPDGRYDNLGSGASVNNFAWHARSPPQERRYTIKFVAKSERHRYLSGIVRPDYQRPPRSDPARLANV